MSDKIKVENFSASPSNAQIRKFSWKRTKACYWKLVIVALIAYIPTFITILIQIPVTGTLWATIISYLVNLIFTPLTIGITVYSYDVYLNGKSKFNKIFVFFRKKRLLITSFLLGLFNLLLQLMAFLPSHIWDFFKNNETLPNYETVFYVLLALLYLFIFIFSYFQMRLYLTDYIFIREPNKKASAIIKESFNYTKGRVHNIIWFGITVLLGWIFIIYIFMWFIGQFIDISILLINVQISLLPYYIFVQPYVNIAFAGYAHKMIEYNKTEK